MIDYDWGMRARTRPGYMTYRRTPAGDPTSPYRPARSEDAATIATACTSPATCTACRAEWIHRPLVTELDGGATLLMTGTPRELLPEPVNCPAPDSSPDVNAPRPWWQRMTRRKP